MSFPKIVIGVASLGLIGFIVLGFALPGTWDVSRELEVSASPERIWPNLVDLERWEIWTSVGQVEATLSDPSSGVGATRAWDSADWGSGRVEIMRADAPTTLGYEVAVQEGELTTSGLIELIPTDSGTRVVWREQGDFGWNPLLGYMALGMDRMQGQEMEKSLTRLDSLLNAEAPSAVPTGGN